MTVKYPMDENLRQAIVNFLTQIRGLAPNPLSGIDVDISSSSDFVDYGSVDIWYTDVYALRELEELDSGGLQDLMLFLLKASIT